MTKKLLLREKMQGMQGIDLAYITSPSCLSLGNGGCTGGTGYTIQSQSEKFEKMWSVWSILFHYFDSASLIYMTSVNQKSLSYKKHVWKILLSRQCNEIHINLNCLNLNLVNMNSIGYRTVYFQLKQLTLPLNDPYFIIEAAKKGYAAAVELAAAHYPDRVNIQDVRGLSALNFAVILGHAQVVKILLKHGAKTAFLYTEGFVCGRKVERFIEGSMFMIAALRGHIDVLKVLFEFEYEAGVKATDLSGQTVLIQMLTNFVERKNVCISILIRYFDHPVEGEQLTPPFKKDDGSIDLISKFFEPDLKVLTSCDRMTRVRIIEDAVLKGYREVISVLLEFTPDLEARDYAGRTALMLAASQGHIDVVTVLLSHHANALACDYTGKSVLVCVLSRACVIEEWKALVKLLLKYDADIDMPDHHGVTPLMSMVCMCCGQHDVVEALLAWGADVNAADFQGRTVLMYAIEKGTVAMVRMLLNAPVPPHLKAMDHNKNTALMLAQKYNRQEIVDLLIEASRQRNILERSQCKRSREAEGMKETADEVDEA